MTDYVFDHGTYGATMGGLMGAICAAKRGLTAVVLEWSPARGGMTEGGLGGAMDYIREPHRSGLTKEWYDRVRAIWIAENPDWASKPAGYYDWDVASYINQGRILFAPKHARQATDAMLSGLPVTVIRNIWIDHVERTATGEKIYLTNGDTYFAKNWHDASYELDLARKMGVTIDTGRDGMTTYNESIEVAGRRPGTTIRTTDVLDAKGNLWPYIRSFIGRNPLYSADQMTMQYVYRMTISKHPNRLPFTPPPGYRRKDFEWFLELGVGYTKFEDISSYKRINEYLYGTNGPNLPGVSWGYPETTDRAARLAYWDRVQYLQRGMYWTALQDPAMTPAMRADVALHGLPHDDNSAPGDYYGTPGWSSQCYVREAARMVSDDMILDKNVLDDVFSMQRPDPINLHGYGMDSHPQRNYALVDGGSAIDGPIEVLGEGLYQIGLANVQAPKGQAPRLVVSWGFAQSRSVLCSSRIEPPAQMQGEICGLISAIACDKGIASSDVTYAMLKPELTAMGAYLTGVRT